MVVNPDRAGFGVYLHWPFCAQKCPYCDFNSHVRAKGVDEDRYLDAFTREIESLGALTGPRSVSSIFIGGGTPSLLQPRTVAALLGAVARVWTVESGAEITLEANPNSVEAGRFRAYRSAGINRVSIGVQALDDASLAGLGRLHNAHEAIDAIKIAAHTFENYSFDLIYARPGQTVDAWRSELQKGIALAGGHLSLYQLTIESGTAYANLHAAGKLVLPDDTVAEDMYAIAQDMTEAANMPAYEISNHAEPGHECRHNLLYWRYGEYVGIGPGAHGRIIADGRRVATSVERLPEVWLDRVATTGHGLTECDELDAAEMADESLLMGLRLTEGLDLQRLEEIGKVRPRSEDLRQLIDDGFLMLKNDGQRAVATRRGRMVLNSVVSKLAAGLVPV